MKFLSHSKDQAAQLRILLDSGRPLTAPGCYDALGAGLIQEAGFDVAYMTGFGTSASLLGRPDVGRVNQGEMLDNQRNRTALRAGMTATGIEGRNIAGVVGIAIETGNAFRLLLC